jgi:hypothetical protein
MQVEVSVYKHTFTIGARVLSIESTNVKEKTVWNELVQSLEDKEEPLENYDSHSYIDTGKSAVVEIDFDSLF